MEFIERILLNPFFYLSDPGSRLYIGYLATSLIIAGLFYWYVFSTKKIRSLVMGLCYIFPRDIWLHRSTGIDVFLLFLNSALKALVFGPLLMTVFTVSFYTVKGLHFVFSTEFNSTGFGIATSIFDWSPVCITVIYTIVLVLFTDLTRYGLHRLLHEVPVLWRLHKVHHSAEVMTPLTLYRSHPIEVFFSMLRDVLSIGFITGCCFYLFGEMLDVIMVAGVNIGRYIFNMIGANLRHSHIKLSYGPVLEKIFISPAQHQVHHSNNSQHYNKNYGSQFAIWDALFGTLYVSRKGEKLIFGL